MSWWWTSSGQTPTAEPSDSTLDSRPTAAQPTVSQTTADNPHQTAASSSEQPPAAAAPTRPTRLSRDEQAEADLAHLLSSLSAPSSPSPSPSTNPTTPTTHPPPPDFATTLYPTTLSCRALFDSAFYCQSLGGQFNAVYRHGRFRSCSAHWADFWFCMRARALPPPQKEAAVRDHYARKEARCRAGPCSEDVWEARGERVEGAFARDPDAEGVFERVLRRGARDEGERAEGGAETVGGS